MGGKKKSAESNSSLGKQLIKSKTKKVYMKGEGPGGLGFKVVSILFEIVAAYNYGGQRQ